MLRDHLPRSVRVELARLRRLPRWIVESPRMARRRGRAGDIVLARHSSPLRREGTVVDERLQAGKEANVALAAARLDGLVIAPGQVLSYHHAVGRPARWRGFRPGLELHDGALAAGVGGGACQVANLVYWIGLGGAMTIVERHRHTLDLFPDDGRTVPFGCGATVFYNWADLRFANPLDGDVSLHLAIADGHLVGELRADRDPGIAVEIYEVGHRFVRDGDAVWRENQVRRRISTAEDGAVLTDHLIAANRARVAYPVDAELIAEAA